MDVSALMRSVIQNGGMASLPKAAQEASIPSEILAGAESSLENRPAVLVGKDIGFNGKTVSVKVWEWDYSEADAITRAWQEDSFAIGLDGWMDTPTKGMSLEEYTAYRRETATQADVNWEQLARDIILNKDVLAGKDMPVTYDANAGYENDYAAFDYFAARYASTYAQLAGQFSGEQLAMQVTRLDDLFATAVGRKAEEQALLLSEGLAEYGITGEKEAIEQSYISMFHDRKTDYLNFVAENKDYAGIQSGDAAWLENDGRFMAASLQRAYVGTKAENLSSDAAYSGDDLRALGIVLDELEKDLRASSFVESEEAIGLRIGHSALKVMSAFGVAGTRLNGLTQQLVNGYASKVMDKADSNILKLRSKAESKRNLPIGLRPIVDHTNEAFLNRKAVLDVLNRVVNASQNGSSVAEAMQKGLAFARESYRQNQSDFSGTLRYGSDSSGAMDALLQNFNSIDQFAGRSKSQDMMVDWELFQRKLGGESLLMREYPGLNYSI